MEFDSTSINLEAVIADRSYYTSTRVLASTLMVRPYFTIGEWLQSVQQDDLLKLIKISEEQSVENQDDPDPEPIPDFENVVLSCMMLMIAEGLDIEDHDVLHGNVNAFIVMLTMENLRRKKLVDIAYDKLSFGEELQHEVVCTPLPAFEEYIRKLEEDDDDDDEDIYN
jgi:hypothetical protein